MQISASILAADLLNLESQLNLAQNAGVDMLHVDVMDGHAVNNINFGPQWVAALKKVAKVPLDVHLMITHPETHLDAFIKAGSDSISFHLEHALLPIRLINQIKQAGIKAAVAINPSTPVAALVPLLSELDMVLLMSVVPGFAGQQLKPEIFDKIKQTKQLIENAGSNTLVQVDGGVNDTNAAKLKAAGCDVIVTGSYLFKHPSPGAAIAKLKQTTYAEG